MHNNITRAKILILGGVLAEVIAIPLTVYLVQQQKDTRSRADVTAEETVIVTINGQDITRADIRKVAEEDNDPSVVDTQALADALEIIKERKILDATAKAKGITVNPVDVNNQVSQEGITQAQASYEVLRDKVILSEVKSRKVNSVSFWSPPNTGITSLTQEEVQTAQSELAAGIPALSEIETKLNAGEKPLDIGQFILNKYPVLSPVLAVNGYILSKTQEVDKQLISSPQIEEFGDSNLDPEALNKLFDMQVGDVSTLSNLETNKGGIVFQLIEKGNDSGVPSYASWLSSQEAILVIVKNPL